VPTGTSTSITVTRTIGSHTVVAAAGSSVYNSTVTNRCWGSTLQYRFGRTSATKS
jgi:hypothetical protein